MNFLAHLYLSANNKESIIGNFIADHVKGNNIELYSEEIKSGIKFHRSIDQFTDSHPRVHESILHLRPYFHKYSGVALDMYYDHFLALNWDNWSDEPLIDFTNRMFKLLTSSMAILPPRSQFILPYMMAENWLLNYRDFKGLNSALNGISSRTTFQSNLESATSHLRSNYIYYQDSFNDFFPQLVEFSKLMILKVDLRD